VTEGIPNNNYYYYCLNCIVIIPASFPIPTLEILNLLENDLINTNNNSQVLILMIIKMIVKNLEDL
jgi:hypothetical protein